MQSIGDRRQSLSVRFGGTHLPIPLFLFHSNYDLPIYSFGRWAQTLIAYSPIINILLEDVISFGSFEI